MIDINNLIERYAHSERVKELQHHLVFSPQAKINLSGMRGSMPALVFAALSKLQKQNAVFILNDKEEAAYFANDLENLLGEKNILFFPASFKKSADPFTIDNNHVLLRAEVLNHISKHETGNLIVTYAEAVSEKVTTKKSIQDNTFDIKRGDKLSVSFLEEFLEESEFQYTDFVYEAGQYAVRGGIMDIFSFAYELPFRIEFDDDKIISIRTFEPGSQLSVQPMDRVSIIPNVQTRLLKESREPFWDFLPKSFAVFLKDYDFMHQVVSALDSLLLSNISNDDTTIEQKRSNDFSTANETLLALENRTVVEFGMHTHFKNGISILFNALPQPSFNKNFELIYKNLLSNQEQKIENLIVADQSKQIERIYAIFDDIKKPEDAKGIQLSFGTLLLSLHEGFIDNDLRLAVYTDHQLFNRYHRYRLKKGFQKSDAITLKDLYSLKPGDYVTHIDHGVGRFGGLETVEANGKIQEAVRLIYKDNDILYISIHSLHRIARYSGKDGAEPSLNKLGSSTWSTLKQKAKKKVKDIAKDLIALYAQRRAKKGFAFAPDNYLQTELEASFIYEDTPDQFKATNDVKADMMKQIPMDRLICGDVGFGKTEVAVRAAFKAVCDGKQVAVLVPTTILALQHARTFSERLKEFPCTVDYINRFKSSAEQKITLQKLEAGRIDIIIGTHRLLSKDVKFKDLGLLIVDEEQKFGVASKEKIKAFKVNVDTLTLTATPIPRTLQFSLMGARDLSIINTAPPNRFPVTTELHVFNDRIIKEAIHFEVSRGGQVFFVHNRISDIHDLADMIRKMLPDVSVAVGHGQMDGEQLEEVLMNFINGDTDVLVSTTIIEAGLDISNANTIIINQAQNFGLSDLHQMRGRVGRSNTKAFCYLLTPPLTVLTPEARQRLKAIEELSELGSGFQVAMRDLDIRGAGNMLGGEQSGFISDIGYETFHKILDEAIYELKHTEFKDVFTDEEKPQNFVRDCVIDTDMEILFPQSYVSNITERLNLYKDLDDIEEEEKLIQFENDLRDRFGPVPPQAIELMNTIRLRWKAKALGFEKIVLKNNLFRGYFVTNTDSEFYNSPVFLGILNYVKQNPLRCSLKENDGKNSLTVKNISNINEANLLLQKVSGDLVAG